MNEQNLELIKTRQLFLKNGVVSGEVLLSDPEGENSFLTFLLKYIGDDEPGVTDWTTSDPYHAAFVIDVRPNAITRPTEPIHIGNYGADKKPLYLGFVVQPQIAQTGEHEVTINFFVGKEVTNGSNSEE